MGPDLFQVFPRVFDRILSQGNNSLFPAFALADVKDMLLQVQVIDLQVYNLIQPDTGGVEHFHDSSVPDVDS